MSEAASGARVSRRLEPNSSISASISSWLLSMNSPPSSVVRPSPSRLVAVNMRPPVRSAPSKIVARQPGLLQLVGGVEAGHAAADDGDARGAGPDGPPAQAARRGRLLRRRGRRLEQPRQHQAGGRERRVAHEARGASAPCRSARRSAAGRAARAPRGPRSEAPAAGNQTGVLRATSYLRNGTVSSRKRRERVKNSASARSSLIRASTASRSIAR